MKSTCKVSSEDAARVLEALDVTEAIFPEREAAYRLAHRDARLKESDVALVAGPDDKIKELLEEARE